MLRMQILPLSSNSIFFTKSESMRLCAWKAKNATLHETAHAASNPTPLDDEEEDLSIN